MKIAILGTRGLPARYGGFETLADRLSAGLVARGHEVIVYGRTGHGQPRQVTTAAGVRAIRVPALHPRGIETLTAGFTAALRAALIDRPDVVLVCNPANVWAARLLRATRIPVLLHVDGLEHLRAKWRGAGAAVHRAAMRSAVRSGLPLLTDSNAMRTWYEEHWGASPLVIRYGTDESQPDAARLAAAGVTDAYDLIVARWEPENQLVEMIGAHAAARSSRHLVVVGEPPAMTGYAERVLAAIAAHPNAHSLGLVWDRALLAALYAGATACLHGHSVGGTNPSLLLAAASGAEVLVHDNAFNREVVNGFGWPWQQPADLTALLAREPWRSEPRASQLRERTLALYRWEDEVAEYEVALARLARDASHA